MNNSEKKKYKKRGELTKNAAGSWSYDFQVNKERHRGTFKEAVTRKQAERLLIKLKNEVFENRHNKLYGRELFEDFVKNEWLPHCRDTKRSYKQDEYFAAIWFRYFGDLRLCDILPEHIRKYKTQRTNETTNRGKLRSQASVNHELGRLGTVFSYAVEIEHLQTNPCKKVKRFSVSPASKRVLSSEEERAILEACKGRFAMYLPLFHLALNTGLRVNECHTLEWQDVNLEVKRDLRGQIISQGSITIRSENSKSKRPRTIPLNEISHGILTELLSIRSPRSERVFHQRGYSTLSVSKNLKRIHEKIGIEGVTFHAFRRTFATRLESCGVSPFTIAALLGHSKVEVTQTHGYVQPQLETLQRAVSHLEQKPAEILQFKTG